jgi:uncharacterized membrane protein YhhN
MAWVCLVAAAGFAVTDWIAVARGDKRLEYFAKPAALTALLLYAALGPNASWYLIAALGLSLLGDVYLMLPVDLFAAGLGAFLLAHIGYIADFEVTLPSRAIWFVLVAAASAPLAWRILRAVPALPIRIAVGLYMAVISLMVGSAIASWQWPAVIGALLFFVSDALIALNRFVAQFRWARLAIIVTYHLGQFGLVTALR